MRIVVGLLGAALLGGPALAADLEPIVAEPVVVEPAGVSWTGVYIGAFAGYHFGEITEEGCVGICPEDEELEDPLLGFQFGADYQFANDFVVGVLGFIPVLPPDNTITIGPGRGFDFNVDTEFAAFGAVRFGYAFDRLLPYVFGGGLYASVEVEGEFTGVTDENDHFGPVGGFGLEYMFTDRLSVDGRYIYSDLSKETYDFGGGPAEYGEDSHNVTVGVNFRF